VNRAANASRGGLGAVVVTGDEDAAGVGVSLDVAGEAISQRRYVRGDAAGVDGQRGDPSSWPPEERGTRDVDAAAVGDSTVRA
jgi:hypothetical protein